jgi:rhodanese-related sulfurtransferase
MATLVRHTPPAASAEALCYFESRLAYETDCWDVNDSMKSVERDFVLVDTRGPSQYAKSRIPGAINIPYGKITEGYMSDYPKNTLFVVYCAGPHCNAAHKAAVRLARLGFPVKEMIGGMRGWADEGFVFASGGHP